MKQLKGSSAGISKGIETFIADHKARAASAGPSPTITIDSEFQALIPPLTDQERKDLQESLQRDGCLDPLVVWGTKNILLDGHHRYAICQKRGIKFRTTELNFTDRDAAADWINQHQLARRNLPPDQMSLLRGRRYNYLKRAAGGRHDRRFRADKMSTPKTAEALAKEHGVTERTIRRDGKYAEAVAKVKKTVPDIEAQARTGKVSKQAVVAAARTPERAPEILAKKSTPPKPAQKGTAKRPLVPAADISSLLVRCRYAVTELHDALRALVQHRSKWPANLNFEALIENLRVVTGFVETLKPAHPAPQTTGQEAPGTTIGTPAGPQHGGN